MKRQLVKSTTERKKHQLIDIFNENQSWNVHSVKLPSVSVYLFFFIHQPFFLPSSLFTDIYFCQHRNSAKTPYATVKSGSLNNCVKRSLDVSFCGKISDIKQKKALHIEWSIICPKRRNGYHLNSIRDTLNHSTIHSFIHWISTTLIYTDMSKNLKKGTTKSKQHNWNIPI